MARRRSAAVILVLLAVAPLFAQTRAPNDWRSFSLHGAVKSVVMTREKLAADPRSGSHYSPGDTCERCTFDPAGYRVEGVLPGGSETTQRDANGWPTLVINREAAGNEVSRSEFRYGPFGMVEMKVTSGGKLAARSVNQFDASGRNTAYRYYDGNGELQSELIYRFDETGREVETDFGGHQPHYRQTQRYDNNGDLVERAAYDADDRPIMQASFRGGRLTSWWMKPGASFGIGFGEDSEPGTTVNYMSTSDGSLLKSVYVHPGRRGNMEPDEVRVYDSAGQLLERVGLTYQRDSAGNWTTREMQVWDLTTNTPVLVERDTRQITYY